MFKRPQIAYAPEGVGAGEGDGGGTPSNGAGHVAEPAWAKNLGDGISGLTGMIKGIRDDAARDATRRAAPLPEPDEDLTVDPEELETMSRADFGNHIVQQVIKAVNKTVVGPVNERLNAITVDTTKQQIRASVNELASAHKDFNDWRDEMVALANENRGLAPKYLYQLARANNPDKAGKLDKKYNPPAEVSGPKRLGFGGLPPNGGSGNGGKSQQKMSLKEATNAAWAETVKALGGEPMFGDADDE